MRIYPRIKLPITNADKALDHYQYFTVKLKYSIKFYSLYLYQYFAVIFEYSLNIFILLDKDGIRCSRTAGIEFNFFFLLFAFIRIWEKPDDMPFTFTRPKASEKKFDGFTINIASEHFLIGNLLRNIYI